MDQINNSETQPISNSASNEDIESTDDNGETQPISKSALIKDLENTPEFKRMKLLSTIFATFILTSLFIVSSWLMYKAKKDGFSTRTVIIVSALGFSFGATILTLREMYLHLTHWYLTNIQRHIMVIMSLVPVYAWTSLLVLYLTGYEPFLYAARNVYSAFVSVSFLVLLVELLDGEDNVVRILSKKDSSYGTHRFIFKYIFGQQWEMGEEFWLECKWGILQLPVIQLLDALTLIIFRPSGIYDEKRFLSWKNLYPYALSFKSICVLWASYSLLKFRLAVTQELTSPINYHPFKKFLYYKLTIVLTTLQRLIIAILAAKGVFEQSDDTWPDGISVTINNYLIVVESILFAVLNRVAYPYTECIPQI